MSEFLKARVERALESLVARANAALRKYVKPCPDIQAAENNDTLAALIRAEKELAQLTAYKKEAEKYIASLTSTLSKQRDRAEKAEELLRAYEVVVSRRVE